MVSVYREVARDGVEAVLPGHALGAVTARSAASASRATGYVRAVRATCWWWLGATRTGSRSRCTRRDTRRTRGCRWWCPVPKRCATRGPCSAPSWTLRAGRSGRCTRCAVAGAARRSGGDCGSARGGRASRAGLLRARKPGPASRCRSLWRWAGMGASTRPRFGGRAGRRSTRCSGRGRGTWTTSRRPLLATGGASGVVGRAWLTDARGVTTPVLPRRDTACVTRFAQSPTSLSCEAGPGQR